MEFEIVVVGTSWGGLSALRTLISGLPGDFPVPVVLVQHRHRESDHLMSTLLQDTTTLAVCEVEDKSPIQRGNVYIAPADYHLLIDGRQFALSLDAPVRYSRPSIDVTFESAADSFGARSIGVVLTGANADGAAGLRRIADRGGLAIVQRPDDAESPTMPSAALQAVPAAHALALGEIPGFLASVARGTSSTHPRPPAASARHTSPRSAP